MLVISHNDRYYSLGKRVIELDYGKTEFDSRQPPRGVSWWPGRVTRELKTRAPVSDPVMRALNRAGSTTPVMSNPQLINPWFSRRAANPLAALNLFCFPYAGGGAQIFRRWQEAFPSGSRVQVFPVQYPGRASRLREPPFTDCRAMVDALAPFILPLTDRPFAFFGHSMGAIVAFELACLLRRRHRREPVRLFVSGRRAPQVLSNEPPTYELPDAEFIDELRRLNGTPREVLEHPELMQLMLPILRADFTLTQSYMHEPEPPLNCPITIFGGSDDAEVSHEHLAAWCEQTTSRCEMRMFAGDHFFLNAAGDELVRVVARDLS